MKTYQELKSAVEDYAQRDDFPFNTLLQLAENQIIRRLRVNSMRERWEIVLGDTPTNKISLPPRFIELASIKDDKGYDVAVRVIGENLYLPVAQQNKTIIAEYYFRPKDLNPNDNTNPLLTAYPSIYFAAVMSEVYNWAGDNEEMLKYAQVAVSEIDTINDENNKQTSLAQTYDTVLPSL